MPSHTQEKSELRRTLRALRDALPVSERDEAALRVAQQLSTLPQWPGINHIAIYLPRDAELDTTPIASVAREQGKTLYLPVLAPDKHLDFALWQEGAILQSNRYGIPEPDTAAPRMAPANLDLVCLPLVAWTAAGDRLGMGGGYYDRTLEGENCLKVGLGYEQQRRDALPREVWDVRLDYVATQAALHDCRGHPH